MSNVDYQKSNVFLDRILEKTKKEELEWEKTADPNTFLVVLKDSAVSIRHNANLNKPSYTFDFRDENGDVVESLTISDEGLFKGLAESRLKKAAEIYQLASRQGQKINKTIDRILEQLAA